MESRREERIQKLIQVLKETDKLHLRDAAIELKVSEMTIRRDLNAQSGPLMLLGGYIVADPKNSNVNHYFIDEQKFKNVEQKRYIGQLAAKLINDNDVIFFDSGTTVPFIIEQIPLERRFTGICYSLNTFLALQERPNCRVILCGGEFKSSAYIFTTIGSHNELDYLCPHKAFISAAGISIEHGLTTFLVDEVKVKMQAMAVAQQIILVADHHKFDQIRAGRFGCLSEVQQLITDCLPESKFQHYLQRLAIKITC